MEIAGKDPFDIMLCSPQFTNPIFLRKLFIICDFPAHVKYLKTNLDAKMRNKDERIR